MAVVGDKREIIRINEYTSSLTFDNATHLVYCPFGSTFVDIDVANADLFPQVYPPCCSVFSIVRDSTLTSNF
uniref:Uncharacterized protein n=1 Tax=Magallana gigas TaxID=29159 RepID=K1R4H2_MAGGI